MTIYVLPKWQKTDLLTFDVTSSAGDYRMLSPFTLGPVRLYDRFTAWNMENGWQYAKVYPGFEDRDDNPTERYWAWATAGWANPRAVRYPMGKGSIPLYALWQGERLGYIEARKRIYIPLYSGAVMLHALPAVMAVLQAARLGDIAIKDYDAYDHRALGYSWDDVISDPARKMGHGFVLAMMLEGML